MFNPQEHIRKIQGRDYLDTAWRIAWFRDVHPQGRIETDIFTVGDMIAVKAIIMDAEGHFLASGMATVRDAKDSEKTWAGRIIEKAETAAIGRALAIAGFGTQFTGESDGNHLADSPRENKQTPRPQTSKPSTDIDSHLPPNPPREKPWQQQLEDLVRPLYPNTMHQANGIKAALGNGTIKQGQPINEAAGAIFRHRVDKEFGFNAAEMFQILGKTPEEFKQTPDAFGNAWRLTKEAYEKLEAMPE